MIKRALFLTLMAVLALGIGAKAQSEGQPLERLDVALWPEYDQSAVLVIYRAEVAPEVALPARLTLPIPAAVGQPHAVAVTQDDGQLVNADFSAEPAGPWNLITIETDTGSVWLEYYAPLTIDGETRRFTYRWPGTIPVSEFGFEVQEPMGAQGMEISPNASGRRFGDEGLSYAQGSLGAIEQGEERAIELSYSRASDQLTADVLDTPAFASEPPQAGSGRSVPWLPIVAGLSVAAAVAGAGYLIWLRPRRHVEQPKKRRRRAARRPDEKPRFCHQCGQAVRPGDRFCRRCGSELRR